MITVIFLRVLFRSYPPGMSLLQYFVQKIHVWSGGTSFCEKGRNTLFLPACLLWEFDIWNNNVKKAWRQPVDFGNFLSIIV